MEKRKILPYEEQLKVCERLRKRIDPTYSIQQLIKEYTREEMDEMLAEAQKISNTRMSSLGKRIERLVAARAAKK